MSDIVQTEIRDADIPVANSLDDVPDIFIDGLQGLLALNGVIRIGLYRLNQKIPTDGGETSVQKVFVGQLVFPEVALPGIVNWLGQRLAVDAAREPGANGSE